MLAFRSFTIAVALTVFVGMAGCSSGKGQGADGTGETEDARDQDTGPEVGPEVTPEVAPEAVPEAEPEVVPEVVPEVGPEVPPEVQPDQADVDAGADVVEILPDAGGDQDAELPPAPFCGDGTCNGEETQADCCEDCGCSEGSTCDEGACVPVCQPSDEVCNGQDEDCDGEVDEDFGDLGKPCDGDDADECADGAWVCTEDGTGVVCMEGGPAKAELCNGVDDDCDGSVDEDFPDKELACDGDDADECADGLYVCAPDEKSVVCEEAGENQTELCNGADDDCDGEVDEDFLALGGACDGADGDACAEGTFVCAGDGKWVVCQEAGAGKSELCNGKDDDCDGETDEGFPALGAACDSSDADSCQDDLNVCSGDGTSVVCKDQPKGTVETCNGVDDDCDGDVDEGFAMKGQACDGTDADSCLDGKFVCKLDGTGVFCDDNLAAKTELCNAADDDCDGQTDEDFPAKGTACDGGDADTCKDGTFVCGPDGTTVVCSDDGAAAAELCNGVDDDCDGQVDEGFGDAGQACDGPDADACADGVKVCSEDGKTLACNDDAASKTESCNGKDDDCDGQADEDNGGCPEGTTCTPAGCTGATPVADFKNPANWSAHNASTTDGLSTKGYFGVEFDGRYVYFVPCREAAFHGRMLRYDTQGSFDAASSYAGFDAGKTDGLKTVGYGGGTFDGRYVYYSPFSDGERHGRVLRYDTQGSFKTASSWAAYDAGATDGLEALGFVGAAFDGKYVYFTPFGYAPDAHANVVRYDTDGDFKSASSWAAYNAAGTDGLTTQGYYGQVFDGRYLYLAPFNDGVAFHGRVLRYDTQGDFKTPASWAAYDAAATSGMVTIGYKGGEFDGRYVYFVPFRDDTANHGRVLRYDTQGDFKSAGSWTAYDAGAVDGLVTQGYVGVVFDARFLYFIPYQISGTYHARALRFDTQGAFDAAASWDAFEAKSTGGMNTQGYKFGTFDGRYVYYTPYHNGTSYHGIVLRFDTQGK